MKGERSNILCVVVIPCYNEKNRLDLSAVESLLKRQSLLHVYFVDDGSTDNSSAVIASLVDRVPQVHLLTLPKNRGKAEAVRQGMLAANQMRPKYLGFWDADFATPLDELTRFLSILEQGLKQMVIGSRVRLLGGDITRNPIRHLLGRFFASIVSGLLRNSIYDTQCGAKVFSSVFVETLFAKPFVSRWLFDVEILFRLRNSLTHSNSLADCVLELPLRSWHEQSGSKVKFYHYLTAPFALMKIYWKYRKK